MKCLICEEKDAVARGACATCLARMRYYGLLNRLPYQRHRKGLPAQTCMIPCCARRHSSKGLCKRHKLMLRFRTLEQLIRDGGRPLRSHERFGGPCRAPGCCDKHCTKLGYCMRHAAMLRYRSLEELERVGWAPMTREERAARRAKSEAAA